MSATTPQASIAPSPSISSSRRTSLETPTRSSTVGSPSLGPTSGPAATSNSATQLAAARRNRAALRDFYGLKDTPSQSHGGTKDGSNADKPTDGEEAVKASSILDSTGFDANKHVKDLLKNEGLEDILKIESNLVSEIRSLDGDRKALVYDNYSKLITATDTIRKMRANMDPLTPTTSTLTPAISHIAGTAERLVQDMKSKVDERRSSEEQISSKQKPEQQQQKRSQVSTVKWVVAAPSRYQDLIDKGEKDVVEEDWLQVRKILDSWENKGVEGAKGIRLSCEEIMG